MIFLLAAAGYNDSEWASKHLTCWSIIGRSSFPLLEGVTVITDSPDLGIFGGAKVDSGEVEGESGFVGEGCVVHYHSF